MNKLMEAPNSMGVKSGQNYPQTVLLGQRFSDVACIRITWTAYKDTEAAGSRVICSNGLERAQEFATLASS